MLRFAISCLLLSTTVFCALNCDFRKPCCWRGVNAWEQRHGKSININEFRRTFLVGKSRPPPVGNYTMRVISGANGGSFKSCKFCSTDGKVTVQYRQWQSPTARLRLCWLLPSETMNTTIRMDCAQALASRQSQINTHQFDVVANKSIQLVFLADSTESSERSVVMLDRILVVYNECNQKLERENREKHRRVVVLPSPKTHEEKTIKTEKQREQAKTSSGVTDIESGLRIKTIHSRPKSRHISGFHHKNSSKWETSQQPVDKLPTRKDSKSDKSVELSTIPLANSTPSSKKPLAETVAPIPPPPSMKTGKDFNPLADLLGEDLANFLDPDYETNDYEDYEDEPETEKSEDSVAIETTVEKLPKKASRLPIPPRAVITPAPSRGISKKIPIPTAPLQVNAVHPLSALHRQIPLGVPGECNTRGGCLFENGMCGWTSPDDVSPRSQFRRVNVGLSNFVQSDVQPGQVSIFEMYSPMNENHTVLFDALEWKAGTRLIGCCFAGSTLNCPFATPSEQGALIWQIGQFECSRGTEKIVFICENYGRTDGVCGLDNIRIHRAVDIFFLEPCQKNILSSL